MVPLYFLIVSTTSLHVSSSHSNFNIILVKTLVCVKSLNAWEFVVGSWVKPIYYLKRFMSGGDLKRCLINIHNHIKLCIPIYSFFFNQLGQQKFNHLIGKLYLAITLGVVCCGTSMFQQEMIGEDLTSYSNKMHALIINHKKGHLNLLRMNHKWIWQWLQPHWSLKLWFPPTLWHNQWPLVCVNF